MKTLVLTLAAGAFVSASALASPGDFFYGNCENTHPVPPLVASPQLAQVKESTEVLKNFLGTQDCLEGRKRLANYTEIDLTHVKVNSLANFNDLSGLTRLWVNGPDLNSLSDLTNLHQLADLWLIAGKAKNLTGLEGLRNLSSIAIIGDELTDIQALANLAPATLILDASKLTNTAAISELDSLTSLQLHVKSATQFPEFANLNKLQSAWLSSEAVTDFSALSNLSEVRDLWISGIHFKSLRPLLSLSHLKSLTIANSSLSTLDELKDLTADQNLEAFHSVNNPISNGTSIANLPNLKSLALVASNIKSTEFLSNLNQLESLDLSQNPGINLSYVQQKTTLKSLNLAGSGLTQTDFLQGLSSLETFNAPYNQITAAPQLNGLTKLTNMNLSGNRFANTNDLASLKDMQILFFSGNPINGDIAGLLTLQSLEVLDLANVGLSGRPSLPAWSKLKTLDVSNNSINNVLALGDFTDLESLNMENNQVRDFGPIVGASPDGSLDNVKLLPWLYDLRTAGNPVPWTRPVPTDAAVKELNAQAKALNDKLNVAVDNWEKVAVLNEGGGQVTEDIICLRIYYHFKLMGALNRGLLATTNQKAGVLDEYITPLCTANADCHDDPIEFTYGRSLNSCAQLGSIDVTSSDVKSIKEIGLKYIVTKFPTKYAFMDSKIRNEVQEARTIKTVLDNLFKSQSNASGSISDVIKTFRAELDTALANATNFIARTDRIRVANHRYLQDGREALRQSIENANSK